MRSNGFAIDQFKKNISIISKIKIAFRLNIEIKFAKIWHNYNFRRLSKPAGAQLALFKTYDEVVFSSCLHPSNSEKLGLKAYLVPFFDKNNLNFEKFSINLSQKAQIEQFGKPSLSFKIRSITLLIRFSPYFSKINKNLLKNTEKVNKNNGISSSLHKNLNLENSL